MASLKAVEAWSDRSIQFLAQWIVAHPWRSMLMSLVIVLGFSVGSGSFIYSLDHRAFFGAENPQLKAFEKLQEDYSKTDAVVIALAPTTGSVFTPEFLYILKNLTEASWKIPYSQRVESLTNFQHVTVEGDDISTQDLVVSPQSLTTTEIATIKKAALNEPFVIDSLVNPEGNVAGVRITLNMPAKDPLVEIPLVVNAIRDMAYAVEKAHPEIKVHLVGQTIANKAYPEESQADFTRVWPWFLLTMMVMLVYLYRSVSAMFVTLTACILAVMAGVGLVGFFKLTINDGVIVSPIMILSMAFADGIHLVVNWIQAIHAGKDKRAAMVESLSANIGAMTVTTLMTAVGFLTLHFNDSPPFQAIGYIVAAGVMFALLLTFFFTAPLLILLPFNPPKKISPLMREDSPLVRRFADFVIHNHKVIMVVMAVFAISLMAFIPKNQVNDDIVKYYTPDTTFRKDMEFVNAHLTGIGELNYSLPAGGADNIADPAYLQKVEAYSQWLKQQPNVTQVNSIVDIVKRVNQVMHNNDPAFYRIPDNRAEIAQYLLQYELSLPFGMDLNYLIRFDRSESRVRVSVGTSSGQKIIAVDNAAQAWLVANTPEAMHVRGSSLSLMFANIGERSINSMFGGMLGSLIAESLFVMLAFGAFRLGLASFIGNLVPIGMAFGAWAIINGNIDVGLTVVLGISFSVVVDDTIHFISKYERARKLGNSAEDAIRYAFTHVGFALLATTLVLGLGYAWLANSAIQITVNTAIVTTMTIALALLVDLFLLPALFLLLDKRKMTA